jgi:hypothetical protein
MYSKGHIAILKKALEQLDLPFFTSPSQYNELVEGLLYPDFPCGSVSVIDNKLVEKMTSCGLPRLLLSTLFRPFSLSYQSHKGIYSAWHAMSHDPDSPTQAIAKHVKEYILSCCKQAYERQSMFWLGFAMHTVMDAYSPAHVLRENSYTNVNYDDLVTWLHLYDSELPVSERISVEKLRDLVHGIKADVAEGKPPYEIVGKYPKKLQPTAAFILYDHQQRQALLPLISKKPKSRTHSLLAWNEQMTTFPIMNFYYYPQQGTLFHSLYDRISAVRKADLYDECVTDIRQILRIYHANSRPHGAPASMAQLRRFLSEVDTLLTTRTLAIHDACRQVSSGFDIVRILKPVVKTFVFVALPRISNTQGTYSPPTFVYALPGKSRKVRSLERFVRQDDVNASSFAANSRQSGGAIDMTLLSEDITKGILRSDLLSEASSDTFVSGMWNRHLVARIPTASTIELPIIKNHMTRPEVILKTFTFGNPRDRLALQRAVQADKLTHIIYTFIAMHKYAGFPVKVVLVDSDARYALRHPIPVTLTE